MNDCDKNCMYMYQQHRVCKENQCVCESGYSGDSCQEFICSDGCTFDKVRSVSEYNPDFEAGGL